ncbi:hypothetical protein NIES3974_06110 [Calothrix sp. NIES-3974]|nr:hypothetical protein NIES3974_06110 [Calothrix sp. NIES-3974]
MTIQTVNVSRATMNLDTVNQEHLNQLSWHFPKGLGT